MKDCNLEDLFKRAVCKIVPSSMKGAIGLSRSKDTSFSQIGGLDKVKSALNCSITQQLLHPERFKRLGIPQTKGVLLYGPPGCAKTSLVKALAKETHMTFIAVSAADLYSPFVGDAEQNIVKLFSQARVGAPSIIFIDEIGEDCWFGCRLTCTQHCYIFCYYFYYYPNSRCNSHL